MRKFWFYVLIALLAAVPGLYMRLTGTHVSAVSDALIAGLAILGAGFMLSWGVEAAEEHVSRGLSLAVLALIMRRLNQSYARVRDCCVSGRGPLMKWKSSMAGLFSPASTAAPHAAAHGQFA